MSGAGEHVRDWRRRARLSQLELATRAEVSTRHLSYVETGRSRPSAELLIRLAEHLDVPLRERNAALVAGGHAPAYSHRSLDDAALVRVSDALRTVLDRHLPHPAVVLDRWWDLVDANAAVGVLLDGVAPHLLEPPVNVLRLSLHPDGLAPRIANLAQWRAHLLTQARHRAAATGDPRLVALLTEVEALPVPTGDSGAAPRRSDAVLPLVIRVGDATLRMFSVASSVNTATDVTVSELTVESFYPADDETADVLRRLAPT